MWPLTSASKPANDDRGTSHTISHCISLPRRERERGEGAGGGESVCVCWLEGCVEAVDVCRTKHAHQAELKEGECNAFSCSVHICYADL